MEILNNYVVTLVNCKQQYDIKELDFCKSTGHSPGCRKVDGSGDVGEYLASIFGLAGVLVLHFGRYSTNPTLNKVFSCIIKRPGL